MDLKTKIAKKKTAFLKVKKKKTIDESERGEWKTGLKLNIQKTKILA